MEKSKLVYKKVLRKMYKDTKEVEKEKEREYLKSIKAVYKDTYELVMGYEMPSAYTSVSRKGPTYRTQGATMNGQKL